MEDKAARLLELAREEFEELTEAEEKFFRAVANGEEANYQANNQIKDNPANAPDWNEKRSLKADVIYWICTDKEAKKAVTHSGIKVTGVWIDGEVDLSYLDLSFPLQLWGCNIPCGINLKFASISALFLDGSHIGPLNADHLEVKSSVHLRKKFKINGELRLLGAKIGGDLDCDEGYFNFPDDEAISKNRKSISADGIRVDGCVFLRCSRVKGEVRFPSAIIGGSIECDCAVFDNPGEVAFCANRLFLKGSVFFRDKIKVRGRLFFFGAQVGVGFEWRRVDEESDVILDLRSTSIGILWIEPIADVLKEKIFLNGLAYDQINDEIPKDSDALISFLNLQPSDEYYPQPYEQMAKVLKASGREEAAKKVLIAKNKARLKHAQVRSFEWFKLQFLRFTIGFGYRSWIAACWALGVIALGAFVFDAAHDNKILTTCTKDNHQSFNAAIYSIDRFVPLMDLDHGKHWRPSANTSGEWNIGQIGTIKLTDERLTIYLFLHTTAGWILTTIFIVGLTGVVKQ